MHRQFRLLGNAPHLGLFQTGERKHHAGQLRLREAVQEVTLVLGTIGRAQQFNAALRRGTHAGIVASGDVLRTQSHGMVKKRLELDLGIAQHVRIRRAPGGVLAQEFAEHAILVLNGEIHHLQVDADDIGNGGNVNQILARGAVFVIIIVLPVLHEQAGDLMAGTLEQQRGHSRIHATRHAYHHMVIR